MIVRAYVCIIAVPFVVSGIVSLTWSFLAELGVHKVLNFTNVAKTCAMQQECNHIEG